LWSVSGSYAAVVWVLLGLSLVAVAGFALATRR
jgi:heme exporter protein D